MKQMVFTAVLLATLAGSIAAQSSPARLQKQGTAMQLVVDGRPFLMLGGELGNSSAGCVEDIERIFPKLQRMGLNTVLVPAYWDLTEPTEGTFDFTLTDKVIRQARENQLKVVFLWFGAWKNSMSCYAPLWFKQDSKKYPRAYTAAGKPLEIASSFSENVLQADNRAFAAWMKHIASIDKEEGTVIMIQIENEIGMLENARDYSKEANKLFNAPVPAALTDYLQKNRKTLHPQMLEKWGAAGFRQKGTWQEVFGADIYTDEIFMAWSYATYVERMAQTARSIYNIPLYVNAAMNSRGRKPGEYPSAGPLAHLIDVWRYAAPSIDLLAPDLYDRVFTDWAAKYKLHNNPLFIPEIRMSADNGAQAFYVFGEHDALGFSPFSIEDGPDSPESPSVQAYVKLKELTPMLTKFQGTGRMHGLWFDGEHKERTFEQDGLLITCRHFFTLPWDSRAFDGSPWPEGGGLLIRLAADEYIVAGSGLVVTFETESESKAKIVRMLGEDGFASAGGDVSNQSAGWKGKTRCGIGFVDEVNVNEDGSLRYLRRMNGDQDHQGRHARIPVGTFSILHVKLYEYK
jgi:hypothetical protein